MGPPLRIRYNKTLSFEFHTVVSHCFYQWCLLKPYSKLLVQCHNNVPNIIDNNYINLVNSFNYLYLMVILVFNSIFLKRILFMLLNWSDSFL